MTKTVHLKSSIYGQGDKAGKNASVVREETVGYGGAVVLYYAPDGTISVDVRIDQDTVWLNQKQMAELFATERSVITKHLRNIFQSEELDEKSNVQKMHIPPSDKPVTLYNLDVIISVGYRVNSKRGTQFRIWATRVLRDHILKGYSVNERRLQALHQSIKLVEQVLERYDVTSDQARALLHVVTDYERALDLLDDYDRRQVLPLEYPQKEVLGIEYAEAKAIIEQLRPKFGGSTLFGMEKDNSLGSSLSSIMQTVDGQDAYPSIEEKAAHLLYFLVKNHSFVDGNKRIAAALFLWFLDKNRMLYRPDGAKRIADSALVSMTLMIAESKAGHKNLLTGIVARLVHDD